MKTLIDYDAELSYWYRYKSAVVKQADKNIEQLSKERQELEDAIKLTREFLATRK